MVSDYNWINTVPTFLRQSSLSRNYMFQKCRKWTDKELFFNNVRATNGLIRHPYPDNPQKKNQKTHLEDPKIYHVKGMDIPKQEVAKFS